MYLKQQKSFNQHMMTLLIVIILSGYSCSQQHHDQKWTTTSSLPQDFPVAFAQELDSHVPATVNWEAANRVFPVQQSIDGHLYFIPDTIIPSGATLFLSDAQTETPTKIEIETNAGWMQISMEDVEILNYALEVQAPPDTLPAYYKRSGFIHPLKSRQGQVLTADFPRGHAHQHGVFHAWTRTTFRDSMIDFWNQQSGLGTVRHKELLKTGIGPVFAEFAVALEYLAYVGSDTVVALDEQWLMKVFPVGDHYWLDWQIFQEPHTEDPLHLQKYHYGGAAYRGTERWNVAEGAYDSLVYVQTDAGLNHLEANHSRPQWISMYGSTAPGAHAGVVMMGHPQNPRHPQPVRVHPQMPYMVFAPEVLDTFNITRDKPYRSRYGMLVFDGEIDPLLNKQYQEAYAQWPAFSW